MKGYPIQPLSPLPRVFLGPSQGVEDWALKKKNSEGQSTKKKVERTPPCQQMEIHRGKR